MRHLDLFSGIGGFALAAEKAWGKSNVEHIFCDNEPFSQAVLKKHWPNSKIYGDIKELVAPPPADIVTGGFPCQPFSNAGKRKGTADDRHLWPEMLRVIRLSAPRWIIGENVSGLLTWDGGVVLDTVISDLEGEGYEVWPFVIPAVAVDAPHRRDRVWIVAYRNKQRRVHGKSKKFSTKNGKQTQRELIAGGKDVPNSYGFDVQRGNFKSPQEWSKSNKRSIGLPNSFGRRFAKWPTEPRVGRVAHGISSRVDRIKSLGNAIVPQVATEIMRVIKQIDEQRSFRRSK